MRRKFAVLLTADRAGRLFRTGCRAARVDGQLLPANITLVILVDVRTLAQRLSAKVALVILVDVSTFTENLAADITVMVFVSVGVCRFIGFSAADDAGVPMCVCIARPVGGVTAHGQHFAADIAHVVIVRVVAHTDGQLTNITTVVPVGVLVRRFLTPLPAGSAGAPMLFAVGEPPITVMVRECFTGGKGFFAADAAGTAVIVHCLCAAGSGRFEVDFVGILAVKAVGMPGCGHNFIMADRTELRGGFGGSVTRGVCRFVRLLTAIDACVPVSRGILDPSAERMPLAFPYRSPQFSQIASSVQVAVPPMCRQS